MGKNGLIIRCRINCGLLNVRIFPEAHSRRNCWQIMPTIGNYQQLRDKVNTLILLLLFVDIYCGEWGITDS